MKPDFNKDGGLLPAIVQDYQNLEVLMVGYMNESAFEATLKENRVTFYSRSKQRLWTKGEESGHFLTVKDIRLDCDDDAILIKAEPHGPVCHTGERNCFKTPFAQNFIFELEKIIAQRYASGGENSYVQTLKQRGLPRIAQKVGEEAVETVIASFSGDRQHFIDEASDLLFHWLVLLKEKDITLQQIAENLLARHQPLE